jgi:radical SAM protein with 4Fe4S-binding SPASM domain
MKVALGLGLTNECNLACAHCYRPTNGRFRLSLDDVRAALDAIEVSSVNLGTGENALHPDYDAIVEEVLSRGVKLALTSNAYSVLRASDEQLRRLHSIELSLDFPTEVEQDAFRGAGNWQDVMVAAERCTRLGLRTTFLAVMMSINWDRMADIALVAKEHGASFRVNIYQSVKTDRFALTYDQFWGGLRKLLARVRVLAVTEPILAVMLGLQAHGSPCGRTSVRLSPLKQVGGCTYVLNDELKLEDIVARGEEILSSEPFERLRTVPAYCRSCRFVESCGGGCAARRMLDHALDEPDRYCPIWRGEAVDALPFVPFTRGPEADMPKVGNTCSIAVEAL